MRIGGRVNLLIAVPLLALLAVAAVGAGALLRSSVRGDEYRDLKSAQHLRADTLPPPATLLEAWASVNAIGLLVSANDTGPDLASSDAIARHRRVIDRARSDFDAAMAFWAAQGMDPQVRDVFLGDGRVAGEAFFAAIDEQLIPAIDAGEPGAVLAAIAVLEPLYETQKVGASAALVWADGRIVKGEQRTDEFISQVLLYGGAGVALLALTTLLLSVRVRRSIVHPIRGLAAQAKSVATTDLAVAVAATDGMPVGAPVPHLPPFQVSTRDELADLANSFTSVQDTAVDLAAEQSRTRQVVSQNIVNIARRNQSLLGRSLGFIATLEQNERDPAMLDNLFRIDHLTTRMRRNAQSLLVLAGDEPGQLWSAPVPLGDVVRAALSEVEHYGQIELGDVGEVHVQGAVAHEVSHLIAELLENATSFSPPTTMVTVVGRAVPDGHQLAVFDHGLGMSDDELMAANEQLNTVSSLDRHSSSMLGFQVIAKLAQRHDIKVMLTTTPGGTGVTAVVRLPKSLLEDPSAVGSDTALAHMGDAAAQLTAPLPVTSMSVEPMTLESIHTGGDVHQPVAVSAEGLPKRVRGAQLPDLGAAHLDAPPTRGADEVRDALSSLQRGIDLGRRQAES